MPADRLAAILPFVREVLETPTDENWCATFEANANPALWVQFMRGNFNAAYPHEEEPLGRLERHGLSREVEEVIAFEAGAYVTFILGDTSATVSARFVDAWFSKILALGSEYTVDVRLEDLGG